MSGRSPWRDRYLLKKKNRIFSSPPYSLKMTDRDTVDHGIKVENLPLIWISDLSKVRGKNTTFSTKVLFTLCPLSI